MIRVAVVDDHAVVRAGLRALLHTEPDLALVAEAASGTEVVNLLRQHELDVLLLDLSMAEGNGMDAMVAVKARQPALPVLIFSAYDETRYAPALLRRGASGYVSKESDPADLVRAIRTVHKGRRYVSPAVAHLLAEELARGNDVPAHESLSERELQVFLHLAEGATISEVARRMSLSVKTISTYRTRLMLKLKLHSNSELTYYALKNGLIH
ncbi:response regulator containing a CheY-like receiver domain and an HTH DNA-binding domain [Burkholderiales bacterium JOSHI_001]|nr:response regulator containing a CheY-like receiver domain and an HTH DNA-binding domain [Burkholderiales bacterium JOSHI_001]